MEASAQSAPVKQEEKIKGSSGMPPSLRCLALQGGESHSLPARLFVCTAKPVGFAETIVEHFGLGHLFERVYGADLEGRFDDKGLLIEHIIGVEQIDPTRMVMIGAVPTICWPPRDTPF